MTNREWREQCDRLGRLGEGVFARHARQQGWYLMRPGQVGDRGGAPMAEGPRDKVIAPDFLLMLRQQSRWADVKTKTQSPMNERGGFIVTGCALRNWEHYLKIADESGIPGMLAFVQADRGQVWYGDFNQIAIGSHTCTDLARVKYATIYFRASQFDRYDITTGEMKLLSKAAILPTNDRYLANHDEIVKKVITDWKQLPLNFGDGGRR